MAAGTPAAAAPPRAPALPPACPNRHGHAPTRRAARWTHRPPPPLATPNNERLARQCPDPRPRVARDRRATTKPDRPPRPSATIEPTHRPRQRLDLIQGGQQHPPFLCFFHSLKRQADKPM